MKYTKLIILGIGLFSLSWLALTGLASAQSFQTGDTVNVASGQTINSMLFASGNNVTIAGTVNGDVYCAGQTITISGTINGDVFCAGQTIVVTGQIDGSARLAGQTVNLGSTITGSATIAAQTLVVDKNAMIGRDLLGGSQSAVIDGAVSRDVVAGSKNLAVNGQIGRNLKGDIATLTVGPSGQIGGSVDYTGNSDPVIASGGQIAGPVKRTAPPAESTQGALPPVAAVVGWLVYGFISMLVLGLVLVSLFPRVISQVTVQALSRPGRTTLVGLAAAIAIPILIMVLLISAIGAPLAVLIGLLWLTIVVLSSPLAGYALGRLLLPKSTQPLAIMALGLAILAVTYFIPIIGFLTGLAAYLFATGMVLDYSRQLLFRASPKKVTAKTS